MRIDQTFPRCARCGKMIHLRAPRIELGGAARRSTATLCSERCRDEYVELWGLTDRGEWREPRETTAP